MSETYLQSVAARLTELRGQMRQVVLQGKTFNNAAAKQYLQKKIDQVEFQITALHCAEPIPTPKRAFSLDLL